MATNDTDGDFIAPTRVAKCDYCQRRRRLQTLRVARWRGKAVRKAWQQVQSLCADCAKLAE